MGWTPSSWRAKTVHQQPSYENPEAFERALARVRELPPLVFSGEVERLKRELAQAEEGHSFVLHGGDCAERFRDVNREIIVRKLKIMLQMSLVLSHGARKPVVRIGRIAGQFAKPRSKDTETVGGIELPSYRGDLVNDLDPTPASRRSDPGRLLDSYFHSAATLNFIRALVDGGFADLRHPEAWQLDFMGAAPQRSAYQAIADRIQDAIDFFDSIGGVKSGFLERAEIYTSHEGLVLPYEEAFTVRPPRRDRFYNLGAHYLWVGDRTRQLDGAHVEYFRGIGNPIGVKIGPGCPNDELARLVELLNPDGERGRLTLITRYGENRIAEKLPEHIRTVRALGIPVLWASDPMHGNGIVTSKGVKTRSFDAILSELRTAFEVHESEGTVLGGVHFELTGDDVTECVGGAQGIAEDDLERNYDTGCDPRLNYAQSLEMAFLIAHMLRPGMRGEDHT